MRDSVKIIIACIVCLGVVGAAGIYVFFSRNKQDNSQKKMEFRQNGDIVEYRYEGEDDNAWQEFVQVDAVNTADVDIQWREQDGFVQYLNADGEWVNFMKKDALVGAEGKTGAEGKAGAVGAQGPKGEPGADGRDVELRSFGGYLQWRYTKGKDQDWKTLIAISALSGMDGQNGQDGRSVEFDTVNGTISWRYKGDSDASWRPIMAVAALKGEEGKEGKEGPQGPQGEPGKKVVVDKTDSDIVWKYEGDDDWTPLISISSLTGTSGREIEIQKVGDYIKWRYVGEDDNSFREICALTEIKGEKGDPGADANEIEITRTPSNILWRYKTGSNTEWQILIPVSELKGQLAADIDIRLKRGVVIQAADPDAGTPEVTEDQIQYKSKDAEDIDANWKKLCTVDEFGLTITVTPVEKQSWTAEDAAPSMTLETGKQYSVTITITGENSDTTAPFTASASCAGKTVSGTWQPATSADDGAGGTIITNSAATYSGTFVVTGDGSTPTYSGLNGLVNGHVTIIITEL